MKFFSIVMIVLLTSCCALSKHKDDIKAIGHDVVDEGIDNASDWHEEQ
jgi:hypothetical protein